MRLVMIAAGLCLATAAVAQHPDTLQMSCDQARAIVSQRGAAVLNSGPRIYDRYVANSQFCEAGEVARASFAPTRDTAYCPIGGVCRTPESDLRRFPR